jgi:hypothetical protein
VRKAVSESRIFISADLLKEYRDVPSALASQGKITVEQFNTLIAGIAALLRLRRWSAHEKSKGLPRLVG